MDINAPPPYIFPPPFSFVHAEQERLEIEFRNSRTDFLLLFACVIKRKDQNGSLKSDNENSKDTTFPLTDLHARMGKSIELIKVMRFKM